jgi:hypothetical protein
MELCSHHDKRTSSRRTAAMPTVEICWLHADADRRAAPAADPDETTAGRPVGLAPHTRRLRSDTEAARPIPRKDCPPKTIPLALSTPCWTRWSAPRRQFWGGPAGKAIRLPHCTPLDAVVATAPPSSFRGSPLVACPVNAPSAPCCALPSLSYGFIHLPPDEHSVACRHVSTRPRTDIGSAARSQSWHSAFWSRSWICQSLPWSIGLLAGMPHPAARVPIVFAPRASTHNLIGRWPIDRAPAWLMPDLANSVRLRAIPAVVRTSDETCQRPMGGPAGDQSE